jgi:RNA polymerase sigma-70 factor (ECF subfamily)
MWATVDGASGEVIGIGFSVSTEGTDGLKNDGLEQTITQLYDTLRPPLYRYLINIGVLPQDVEEVVQESFLRLYQHIQSGGNEDNLRGWIFKVAHNLSVNILKGRRRQVEITPELWEQLSQSASDQAAGPEEQLLQKERVGRIHDWLADLTQLQRDCLNLRVEGFRYREIGEILNIGTSTVAGSLRNAITGIVKRRA